MQITDELEAMREMFGEDFAMLAALYLGDSPKRIAALQAATIANDIAQVGQVAHTLGGSCASMGASGLAALCQAMELDCRSGNADNFAAQLLVINAEYARIVAKLRILLQA